MSRWSLSATRSASTATIWCSRNPPTATPPRCSPTCRGTPLCMVDVAGSFGRDLSAHGEAAMVDFAVRMAGGALRRRSQEGDRAHPRHALECRAAGLGAASAAVPGGQIARRSMMEPVNDRLVRRRSRARDAMGHGRRRLGIRRARRYCQRMWSIASLMEIILCGYCANGATSRRNTFPSRLVSARATFLISKPVGEMGRQRHFASSPMYSMCHSTISSRLSIRELTPATRRRCACRLRRRSSPPAPRSRRRSWSCRAAGW